MKENNFVRALLDTIPSTEYSPVVLIIKNSQTAKLILDDFKSKCKDQGIILIDGCKMILDGQIDIIQRKDICILFENLEFIIEKETYESSFFTIFNYMMSNCIPMVITLSKDIDSAFQGRNKSRLLWGVKAEIT